MTKDICVPIIEEESTREIQKVYDLQVGRAEGFRNEILHKLVKRLIGDPVFNTCKILLFIL